MSPAYRPAEDRFWEKVTEHENGCWIWTAALNEDGYGKFNRGRGAGMMRTHCWSYEHLVGPVPEGLVLDHLCRQPACVNPDHLEPVTQQVNVRRGSTWNGDRCSRGHDMSDVYMRPDRKHRTRRCRKCHAENERQRRAKAA